jgi:hypothetical protein
VSEVVAGTRRAEPFQAVCIFGSIGNRVLRHDFRRRSPARRDWLEMGKESKGSQGADGTGLQRAIVLQLLRDDRERMWSRAQLEAELCADREEVCREAVERALRALAGEGVLDFSAQAAWASNATRRLDEIGLICV